MTKVTHFTGDSEMTQICNILQNNINFPSLNTVTLLKALWFASKIAQNREKSGILQWFLE